MEKRFGASARLIASLTYSLQMILYMGVVLYAPALALEAITNMSKANSILIIGIFYCHDFFLIFQFILTICVFPVGFVCTFYSTIGGMKAVLVTDVFQ